MLSSGVAILKVKAGERRVMEVEVENINVTIKLKITPAKHKDN